MSEIGEGHNGLIANVDHTLQCDMRMCQLLQGMRQHDDIETIGRKAMQTVVDIFLNDIQPFAD